MPIELATMALDAVKEAGKIAVKETAETAKEVSEIAKTGLESGMEHLNLAKTGLESELNRSIFGSFLDSPESGAFGIEKASEVTTGAKELTSKSVFDTFGFNKDAFLAESAKPEVKTTASELPDGNVLRRYLQEQEEIEKIKDLPETNVLLQACRDAEFEAVKAPFWDGKKYYSLLHGRYFSLTDGNCFCFASGFPVNPLTGKEWKLKTSPGELSGATDSDRLASYTLPICCGDAETAKRGLLSWLKSDYKLAGKEIAEVKPDYNPKKGERMIYVCGNPSDGDYHFMLKGSYGTWYHKRGLSEPLDRDEITGERIFNPADTAERDGYTMNLGYYVLRDVSKEV